MNEEQSGQECRRHLRFANRVIRKAFKLILGVNRGDDQDGESLVSYRGQIDGLLGVVI
jgi:hypothetical protein